MEAKRKIEILKLVGEMLLIKKLFIGGFCGVFTHLLVNKIITSEECIFIQKYVNKNKPNMNNEFKHFTETPYWKNNQYKALYLDFWWDDMKTVPLTRYIRIRYINELILKIERTETLPKESFITKLVSKIKRWFK